MIISHKYRFIYYAPVKTATTSLLMVLTQHFEAEVVGPGNNRHSICLPAEYAHYFTFVSIRNPYDRALSGFNYLNQDKPVSVMSCLNDKESLLPSLYDSIYNSLIPDGCIPVRIDRFLRQENLQADFDSLPFLDKKLEIPKLNVSVKKQIAFGIYATEQIKNFYFKDFEFFGYDPEKAPDFGLRVML